MRKSVAAATMAASLTLGGAAGVALFTPELSSATAVVQDDSTTDAAPADRPDHGERLGEVLAPLVEDGTITQAQSDAVVEALVAARPERGPGGPGHHGRRGPHAAFGGIVEELTGLSAGDIRSAFESGTTLRELLESNGSNGEAFVDAVVAEVSERLATAVENGRLTQEEADEKLAEVEARVTAALDAERPSHPGHPGDDAEG